MGSAGHNEKIHEITPATVKEQADIRRRTSQVYLQQNKKKAEAEGNNCHAKTMWRQEKPIQLV